MNISTACLICEKVFVCLRILLSMKFGFKKVSQEKLQTKSSKQGNQHKVSFSYFLIYFPDLLITFENYCLLKASMNFLGPGVQRLLSVVKWIGCNFIVYYFTYLPFFFVLFELKYAPCRCPISLPDLLQSYFINFNFLFL